MAVMTTREFHHAKLMREMQTSGVTVEDLARAWASMDGKLQRFDRSKVDPAYGGEDGSYEGYLVEAEEIIERATKYAVERKGQS